MENQTKQRQNKNPFANHMQRSYTKELFTVTVNHVVKAF